MHLLPVELQRQCLNFLANDVESLRALRLTNRQLLALATEFLFRTVAFLTVKTIREDGYEYEEDEIEEEGDEVDLESLTSTALEKYLNIQSSRILNPIVTRIIFNTSPNPDETYDSRAASDFTEAFESALESISKFPNLREVELKFARECAYDDGTSWEKEVHENISFRNMVLEAFCNSLKDVEKLDSLTIKNLQDFTESKNYERDSFTLVLAKLKNLHLQITSEDWEHTEEGPAKCPGVHQGFTQDLPNGWLKPLQGQLSRLTLYSTNLPWGVYPFVDLRSLGTLPSLKSLSLGNFTIAHEWQIDWIISHAATLEELLLDACPIIVALRMDEEQASANFPGLAPSEPEDIYGSYFSYVKLRWCQVFSRFRTELPMLKRFTMGKGDWERQRAFEGRYELLNRLLPGRYRMFDNGDTQHWFEKTEESPYRYPPYPVNLERHYKEVDFPTCDDEDMTALGELLQEVGKRASAKE